MAINYQILTLIIILLLVMGGAAYTVNYYDHESQIAHTQVEKIQAELKNQQDNNAVLNERLAASDNELQKAKFEVASSNEKMIAASTNELQKAAINTNAVEQAQLRYAIMREAAGKLVNSPEICGTPPAKRSCENYNIQFLAGQRYICPANYTIMDGYPAGGMTGPVCKMNDGGDGTPKTCKDSSDPRCDPQLNMIACFGPWPCSKYPCNNYYGKWFVIKAIPSAEVCGK